MAIKGKNTVFEPRRL